jgi:hypothetical protein
MSTLEIVWRNPNPVEHTRRWQPVRGADGRVTYLAQEFSYHGFVGYWSTISHLEVLHGWREAWRIQPAENCIA